MLAVGAGVGGQDVEDDLGIFGAANQLDGFVHAGADHVGDRAVTLADADDAVAHGELAGAGGGPAGHELADGDVFVTLLQHRADTHQREAHRDVEIVGGAAPQVVGVGLDRHRVGVHEHLEDVFALVAGGAGEVVVVALAEGLADVLVVLAGELEAQPVVLDTLAPQVADLGVVLRPWGLVAGVGVAFLDAEVEVAGEQLAGVGEALGDALLEALEDGEGRAEVALQDRVVEARAGVGEAVDVGLGEEQAFRVEGLEVAVEDLLRHRVVEGHALVVVAPEDLRAEVSRLGLVGRGGEAGCAEAVLRGGLAGTDDGQGGPDDSFLHSMSPRRSARRKGGCCVPTLYWTAKTQRGSPTSSLRVEKSGVYCKPVPRGVPDHALSVRRPGLASGGPARWPTPRLRGGSGT